MNVLKRVKEAGRRANRHIRTILRKVSIFRRLNLSFMLLIISAAIFLTFFSFYKYSDEISKNIDKYISLLVQNAAMKIEDTMQEYEEEALRFYDNSQVVRALLENAGSKTDTESGEYEQNRYCIENALYNMGYGRKYIVNVQFVTPEDQYYMVEPGGYRRGGIRTG